MPKIYKCPVCGEEITYLCFSGIQNVYGSRGLTSENFDTDETGDINDITYSCPECSDEVSWSEVLASGQEEEDEEDEEESNEYADRLSATLLPSTLPTTEEIESLASYDTEELNILSRLSEETRISAIRAVVSMNRSDRLTALRHIHAQYASRPVDETQIRLTPEAMNRIANMESSLPSSSTNTPPVNIEESSSGDVQGPRYSRDKYNMSIPMYVSCNKCNFPIVIDKENFYRTTSGEKEYANLRVPINCPNCSHTIKTKALLR
jgi:hypothetical protein